VGRKQWKDIKRCDDCLRPFEENAPQHPVNGKTVCRKCFLAGPDTHISSLDDPIEPIPAGLTIQGQIDEITCRIESCGFDADCQSYKIRRAEAKMDFIHLRMKVLHVRLHKLVLRLEEEKGHETLH
jgi:hypothetical protein